MLKQPVRFLILFLAVLGSQAATAGGDACGSLSSGNWSEPTIWDCGGSVGPPGSADFVTIQNGHTVTLDQDATVNTIVVAPGGDLDVAASVSGFTLRWDEPGSDLSNASIDLAGDLDIIAENEFDDLDFSLGSVDGGFELNITNDGTTTFTADIGAISPLASFSTNSAGSDTWTASLTTTGTQQHGGQITIAGEVTFSGQFITIYDFLDADTLATDRNLTINATGGVDFDNALVGTTVPLNDLTINSLGNDLVIENGVVTTGEQVYNCDLAMNADLNLAGSRVTFAGVPFSNSATHYNLTVTGDALFLSDLDPGQPRGSVLSIGNLAVTGNAEFDIAGGGTIVTNGSQNYQGSMTLNADTTFTSDGGGSITIRASGGAHHLTVNTSGTTTFAGNVGSPAHASITTDAAGLSRCTNGTVIHVESDSIATTFNDTLQIGASVICTVEQLGGADVVFNGPVTQFSGGPKRLIVNDVSGRTVFNNTVNLGQLTTNDGTGDDVTVINTSAVTTTQGGSNNGVATFNDPVLILQDVTFTTTNNGQVVFNNTLDEGTGASGSNVTINSTNTTRLGAVGSINPIFSLTTNAGGSTQLNGDVRTTADQSYNNPVTLNADVLLYGTNLNFNDTVDLQAFDLTLNTEDADLLGAVSGSGNLISEVGFSLDMNAANDYTGQTRIRSGTLDLNNGPSSNNIASSALISLDASTDLIPFGGTDRFDLASGQVLSGTGLVQETLTVAAGATIRPGDNEGDDIGTLNGQIVQLEGGALEIQVDGGGGSDRLSAGSLSLDPNSTLNVVVESAVSTGQQFTIVDVGVSVTGEFTGLPEGAVVAAQDGTEFTISYLGGDGNDVVLSVACESNGIEVTTDADSGAGSLRQAVLDICPGGTITFANDLTIGLDSELAIAKAVNIDATALVVVLSGSGTNRVFNIATTGDLTLNRITLSDGFSTESGGAIVNDGILTVTDSVFDNNESQSVDLAGGAIFINEGAIATVSGSTFTSNEGGRGGAIFNELGNTLADGMLTITNSTFSGNGVTSSEGGAVHNRGVMISINNTIANNGQAGTLGGGIFTWNGHHTLTNTIVADNAGTADCVIDLGNSTENNTASLIETGNCAAALTDDPLLQPLADNGGDTQTIAPNVQSPAVNTGDLAQCPATDQRGVPRPQLGECDIGAYETENLGVIYVNGDGERLGPPCVPGGCWSNAFWNLRDAIEVAVSGAEIWVAQGVYRPDVGGGAIDNDPLESFQIPQGVAIYGGFDGTETARNQRLPSTNLTILSGDIDDNDLDPDGNQIADQVGHIQGTNAYHVLTTEGATGIVLDGFTITAGSAFGDGLDDNDIGGGIDCGDDGITGNIFNDTIWIGNQAQTAGGAMSRCNNVVMSSLFIANESGSLGGAALFTNNANLHHVGFLNNVSDEGGAIWSALLEIDRGLFAGNEATARGGAIVALDSVTISNSLFSGNASLGQGSALVLRGLPQLDNVTVTGNLSTMGVGAIVFDDGPIRGGDMEVRNGVIWNNEDVNGVGTVSAVTVTGGAAVAFSNTLYQGSGGSGNWDNQAGTDNGGNIDQDPLFVEEVDLMSVPTSSGDARPQDDSPIINAGDNAFVNTTEDLDGFNRIQMGTVDMGAYEGSGLLFKDGFEE